MILRELGRIIVGPFRLFFRIFRRGARVGAKNGGRGVGAARATGKAGASAVAKTLPREILDAEYREEPPSGIEAAMFKQLPRPRLTEKSAADLTLEQAYDYAEQAKRFYEFEFPLFPRGDFFYEEIEEEFLNDALGYDADTIDRRFVDVTVLFRRTLNDNTRRVMLVWAPLIGAGAFGAAAALQLPEDALAAVAGGKPWAEAAALYGAAALIAAFLAFLVYSWPYKVVQQRNLLNLDNYVTSKFARINNNFQVAKRRALNVERDKRMAERDALREEAGVWTLAYHWFATRLFLCETMLRNKFYQVRRNTALYWVGGLAFSALLLGGLAALQAAAGVGASALLVFAGSAALYVALTWAVLARATAMMLSVLESNEWSRFHLINLDATIRDHVGEDKLQIVTFRDRNRFE